LLRLKQSESNLIRAKKQWISMKIKVQHVSNTP